MKRKRIAGTYILNLVLLTEVVRRFYLTSTDLPILIGDLIILSCGINVILRVKGILARNYSHLLWLVALTVMGLASSIFAQNSLMILMVGVRLLYMPLLVAFIGAYYSSDADGTAILKTLSFWVIAAVSVAVLQLLLGPDHPFSHVTGELAGPTGGIDVYLVGTDSIPFLFRPTSFFMHTSKFGQALFVMGLYILIAKCELGLKTFYWRSLTWVIVFGVAISGQRAAAALLVTIWLIYRFFLKPQGRESLGTGVASEKPKITTIIAGIVALLAAFNFQEILRFVLERFYFFNVAHARLNTNFLTPIGYILERYVLTGLGMGYLTLGSMRWGGAGAPYLGVERVPGLLEGSWVRIICEIGVLGLVVTAFYLLSIWGKAKRILQSPHPTLPNSITAKYAVLVLPSLFLWGLTHDVFGNYLTLYLTYYLFGPIFLHCEVKD